MIIIHYNLQFVNHLYTFLVICEEKCKIYHKSVVFPKEMVYNLYILSMRGVLWI